MSMQDQNRTTSWKDKTSQSSTTNTSKSEIKDVGVRAQQKTEELIDQAQEKVGEVTDKVKEQATSQVSSQKDRAAEGLGNVAQAIRQTGNQLRQNEQVAPVAQYTDQLAMGVETVSNYLRDHSLSDIVGEVERFARREPALFLGGALTLGLLGGRFLRSSSSSNNQSQNYSSTTPLGRTSAGTSSGAYGSRSTGYSTALSTDPVTGYSAYDLGATPELDTLGSRDINQSASGRLYEDTTGLSSNRDTGGASLNSGSFGTSGYNTSYPVDTFGSESNRQYGSQTDNTGRASGGSTEGA